MKMNHLLQVSVMALALLLVAACQNKGPTPKEGAAANGHAPKVGTTETGGAHPEAATQSLAHVT